MVFFTVTFRLSSDLPDVLRHNVWGSLHMGDFILPMFLFASGVSLAYFLQKRKEKNQRQFIQDTAKRFVKLVFVGFVLSYFSSYRFFAMDEVVLCALLFLCCVFLYRLDWRIILGIIFVINFSYLPLLSLTGEGIFIGNYLGGYPAAVYYLPIMLTGLLIGKGILSEGLWCKKNTIILGVISSYFILFSIFIKIHKLIASPSFMMLAILVSFMIFAAVEWLFTSFGSIKEIEYIGRKPLRYWISMYLVFIIPVWFYTEFTGESLPLQIPWIFGILLSLGIILLLWMTSHVIDYISWSKYLQNTP